MSDQVHDRDRPAPAPSLGDDPVPHDLTPLLPHGVEFRFVDRVREYAKGHHLVAQLDLQKDAPFFAGHFPGRPLMPGVLIGEALAQASGLLMGLTERPPNADVSGPPPQFHLAALQMKFMEPVTPGCTLDLRTTLDLEFGGLLRFAVAAKAHGRVAATGTVTLARIPTPDSV